MKFLFQLVKYANPRRYRASFPVHTDKLISWASNRTYQTFLRELEEERILERGGAYSTGRCSKRITLNWEYQNDSGAIKHEGRSVETLRGAIRRVFDPMEFRQLLEGAGAERTTAYMTTQRVFDDRP